jgi:hypothetical protein
VLPEIRQKYKDPNLWSHLETVGNQYAAYFQSRSGEGYEAFLKRING